MSAPVLADFDMTVLTQRGAIALALADDADVFYVAQVYGIPIEPGDSDERICALFFRWLATTLPFVEGVCASQSDACMEAVFRWRGGKHFIEALRHEQRVGMQRAKWQAKGMIAAARGMRG